ncbi:hypothetical protein [Bradyrhizobium sp. B120]|uniref:hypothetical protein n=1 Tax=Bradyrhizobium sp. B120 TaxID=3410088 RepID=UPI003B987E33
MPRLRSRIPRAQSDLGSLDCHHSQERWAAGGADDFGEDGDSGKGDWDGLLEQVGTQGLAAGGNGMKIQPWHRRQAINVAAALPENDEDALIVHKLSGELVANFLAEPDETKRPATVILIGGSECA